MWPLQKVVNCSYISILSSQVVSLPFQSVIQEVANFCAAMDTLIDEDAILVIIIINDSMQLE